MTTDPATHPVGSDTRNLLDAVLSISSDLDLRRVLDRIVRSSCELTGARHGFLGLLDEDGAMPDFVTHGLPPEAAARIRDLPTGAGALGPMGDERRSLRLADVGEHPRPVGFPDGHPPMRTLGVPVQVEGKAFGNLYLTEKSAGEFTRQDEELVQVLAQVAGFVIANARTYTSAERRHEWLEAGVAMSEAMQDASTVRDALGPVVSHLRRVADAALVAVLEDDGEDSLIVAADGGAAGRDVLLAGARDTVAEARESGSVAVLDADDRAVLVVPLRAKLAPGHLLLVVLDRPLGMYETTPDLLSTYADQASLALDRTQAWAERQEHMLVADRDRIARDLHDTVIQRLFATALQLQGLQRVATQAEVRDRLDEGVAELNATIREIRSTIFELRRDDIDSVKAEVRSLVKDYVPVLGFTPFVRTRGPLDVSVSPATAEHLVAALREALSNVARHAEADACIVEVEVSGGRLVLRVSDNGRGIEGDVCESGLRNVRLRAVELGGRFRVVPEDPHGTLLEWEVPLAG